MVRCAFLEWPEGLEPCGAQWESISREIAAARPDILVTNEMPFGAWLANDRKFDADLAKGGIAAHEQGLKALQELRLPLVISSRPVWAENKLLNQAFALQAGRVLPLHCKQFFPEEAGWYEASWFRADDGGFVVHDLDGLKVGVLLCTELFFNERARYYGRAGADLIVAPRATGLEHHIWEVAGAMAAIVSGGYVVSSNRVGQTTGSPLFGGKGMAFAPDGHLIAQTSAQTPLVVVELDVEFSRRQKSEYPCCVSETPHAVL